MYFIDGKPSTVVKLLVGTGGIAKGELGVLASGKIIDAAAAATDATVVGIALDNYDADEIGSFELALGRLIRSEYTGTDSNLATNKVYDLSDGHTVNINDVADGIFYCVAYDAERGTVDGFITLVHLAI